MTSQVVESRLLQQLHGIPPEGQHLQLDAPSSEVGSNCSQSNHMVTPQCKVLTPLTDCLAFRVGEVPMNHPIQVVAFVTMVFAPNSTSGSCFCIIIILFVFDVSIFIYFYSLALDFPGTVCWEISGSVCWFVAVAVAAGSRYNETVPSENGTTAVVVVVTELVYSADEQALYTNYGSVYNWLNVISCTLFVINPVFDWLYYIFNSSGYTTPLQARLSKILH